MGKPGEVGGLRIIGHHDVEKIIGQFDSTLIADIGAFSQYGIKISNLFTE